MTDHGALLSRRALLAAGVGGVALAAGCTGRSAKPVVDPDAAAINAARTAERSLLATYADGTEAHAIHLAHLRALGDRLPPPSPDPALHGGGHPPESLTVTPLQDAARNAHRGSTAALLASIAASHATLARVRVP